MSMGTICLAPPSPRNDRSSSIHLLTVGMTHHLKYPASWSQLDSSQVQAAGPSLGSRALPYPAETPSQLPTAAERLNKLDRERSV